MPLTVHSSQHRAWPHGWVRTVRGLLMQMEHDSPSSSWADGGAAAGRLFDEVDMDRKIMRRPGASQESGISSCLPSYIWVEPSKAGKASREAKQQSGRPCPEILAW